MSINCMKENVMLDEVLSHSDEELACSDQHVDSRLLFQKLSAARNIQSSKSCCQCYKINLKVNGEIISEQMRASRKKDSEWFR